jgi:hypothetical protein
MFLLFFSRGFVTFETVEAADQAIAEVCGEVDCHQPLFGSQITILPDKIWDMEYPDA